MGEGGKIKNINTPLFQNTWSHHQNGRMMTNKKDGDWIMSEEIQENSPTSSSSHEGEASTISNESSSSLSSSIDDISDDASSSLSSCVSSSIFMAELPIKRGLSKFYQGKSESFTCLARVTSVEDLPKRVVDNPYKKRMKSSKSYGGLDNYKSYTLPKKIISKRGSMGFNKLLQTPSSSGSKEHGMLSIHP